jgi:hypothetical protein
MRKTITLCIIIVQRRRNCKVVTVVLLDMKAFISNINMLKWKNNTLRVEMQRCLKHEAKKRCINCSTPLHITGKPTTRWPFNISMKKAYTSNFPCRNSNQSPSRPKVSNLPTQPPSLQSCKCLQLCFLSIIICLFFVFKNLFWNAAVVIYKTKLVVGKLNLF